jgi:hypothetical protein
MTGNPRMFFFPSAVVIFLDEDYIFESVRRLFIPV